MPNLNPAQFDFTHDEAHGGHTLSAHLRGEEVGRVDYHLDDDTADIDYIQSHQRGQGVGTALAKELQARHPDKKLVTAWWEDPGAEEWADKLRARHGVDIQTY